MAVFLLPLGRPGHRLALDAGRFFCVAAPHLLDADRERAPLLDADQGQREEGQPWHRLAIQTGKEPIEAMGGLAGFSDDDFVPPEQVDILGPIHMVPKEHPKQRGPRHHRGEKALHGPITAPFAGPPGQAQHGDAPRHDEHGRHHPAALTAGRRRHMGLQALYTCENVHRGASRRL